MQISYAWNLLLFQIPIKTYEKLSIMNEEVSSIPFHENLHVMKYLGIGTTKFHQGYVYNNGIG